MEQQISMFSVCIRIYSYSCCCRVPAILEPGRPKRALSLLCRRTLTEFFSISFSDEPCWVSRRMVELGRCLYEAVGFVLFFPPVLGPSEMQQNTRVFRPTAQTPSPFPSLDSSL